MHVNMHGDFHRAFDKLWETHALLSELVATVTSVQVEEARKNHLVQPKTTNCRHPGGFYRMPCTKFKQRP